MCWPRNNNRGRPDKYAGHPKAVYIWEDAVLEFFADLVFGPHRREILTADLAGIDDRAARERQAEIAYAAERINETMINTRAAPAQMAGAARVDAVRALG